MDRPLVVEIVLHQIVGEILGELLGPTVIEMLGIILVLLRIEMKDLRERFVAGIVQKDMSMPPKKSRSVTFFIHELFIGMENYFIYTNGRKFVDFTIPESKKNNIDKSVFHSKTNVLYQKKITFLMMSSDNLPTSLLLGARPFNDSIILKQRNDS